MDLNNSSVAQIMLPVKELEPAVKFYREVLGLPFLFTAPPQMAFFQCGTVRLLIGVHSGQAFAPSSGAIYFQVADIQAVFGTLCGRGVEFQAEPHVVHRTPQYELWLAEFRDRDGNQLALMSQKAKAG